MPHTGIRPKGYITPKWAMWETLKRLYNGIPSRIELIISIEQRNKEIEERYAQGESIPRLAKAFELSNARVHQIIRGKNR